MPRYLLNLLKTVPKQYLAVLKRGTPYDQRALQEQRQMTCNLMFPKIYHPDSSPTKLIESNIDGEMKDIRIKPVSARSDKPRTQYNGSSPLDRMSLESCSIPDGGEDVKISDFLSIAGGISTIIALNLKCFQIFLSIARGIMLTLIGNVFRVPFIH